MSNIFDKFDKQVNTEELSKQVKEAAQNVSYEDTPAGKYEAKIEHMELGMTKDQRPMFKVQMRLKKGLGETEAAYIAKYKKAPCVFMNRVIFGTKNDANMIASLMGWLNSTKIYEETLVFTSYGELADLVLDMAEDAQGLTFEIEYDESNFNSISIVDTFDD